MQKKKYGDIITTSGSRTSTPVYSEEVLNAAGGGKSRRAQSGAVRWVRGQVPAGAFEASPRAQSFRRIATEYGPTSSQVAPISVSCHIAHRAERQRAAPWPPEICCLTGACGRIIETNNL